MAQRIENRELGKSLEGIGRENPLRWSLLLPSKPGGCQDRAPQRGQRRRTEIFAGFVRILIVAGLFGAASFFLLKLAYLGVMAATGIGGALLLTFSIYLRRRFGERIPTSFLFYCWARSKWTPWEIIFICMENRLGQCSMTSSPTRFA